MANETRERTPRDPEPARKRELERKREGGQEPGRQPQPEGDRGGHTEREE